MNTKNIILIASILAVLGLLTATIFNLLTIPVFGSLVTTVLGILYGLLKKFENKELTERVKSLDLQLTYKHAETLNLEANAQKFQKAYLEIEKDNMIILNKNKELVDRLSIVEPINKQLNKKIEELQIEKMQVKEAIVINPVITEPKSKRARRSDNK